MATEGLVWSPDSIMDLNIDTMYGSSGTATLNSGSLVLGANSKASFSYSFDTTDNILESEQLQFILNVVNSNTEVNSRYDESVQVECYIQYYEETVDESGNISGFVLGSTDSYQIMPYFRHEVDGYTNTYEINISKLKAVNIIIEFINESENEVTFISPKVYNSLSIMEAITTYGGGGSGGGGSAEPDEPTLIEDLMLYSTSGKYMIDTMQGDLTLEVAIPDEYAEKYVGVGTYDHMIEVTWIITNVAGYVSIGISESMTGHPLGYTIAYGRRIIAPRGNGSIKVRVELTADPTIYAERTITVINNNITDMDLTVETESGSIEGTGVTNCTLKLLPENTKESYSNYELKVKVDTYGDGGEAVVKSASGIAVVDLGIEVLGGVGNFSIWGIHNGKVKITAEIKSAATDYENKLYPKGFKKEFIVDVVGIPVKLAAYIETPDGTIITGEMSTLSVNTRLRYEDIYYNNSTYGIESVDGEGDAVVIRQTAGYDPVLSYLIYPLKPGKVKFWANVKGYDTDVVYYLEQEIEITGIKKLPEIPLIETNNGLFEIVDGGGQLEVYPRPNYDWHGGFSFSQVSIDGGAVTISDKGDYALITGKTDGKLNLICKPVYGPQAQCEITVSGQRPENINLITDTGINKVAIGGMILISTVYTNNPLTANVKYSWKISKIDSTANYSVETLNNYSQYRITAKAVGRIVVDCMDYTTYELLDSIEIEIVDNIDQYVLPVLTSDSGLFAIDSAGGELVITPSHGIETEFSYELIYVDGGEATLEVFDTYCKLVGVKNGKTRLKVSTPSGLTVYQDISISGQYPEGVSLATSGGYQLLVGGTLTVFATPTNNINNVPDLYKWIYDKKDSGAEVTLDESNDNYCIVTGVSLGRIRLVCMSTQTNNMLQSIELEVVETIEEETT